jgi:hypothetical protein
MRVVLMASLIVLAAWLYAERERLTRDAADLQARIDRIEQQKLAANKIKPWFLRHLDRSSRLLDRPAQEVSGKWGSGGNRR